MNEDVSAIRSATPGSPLEMSGGMISTHRLRASTVSQPPVDLHWEADGFERARVKVQELAIGTFLPDINCAAALLDLAFDPQTGLSPHSVDGTCPDALGSGQEGKDE